MVVRVQVVGVPEASVGTRGSGAAGLTREKGHYACSGDTIGTSSTSSTAASGCLEVVKVTGGY